jgi:hypothetical protein
MRVFLIPTGAERYEPYCEVDGIGADDDAPARRGLGVLADKFRAVVAAVERHEREGADAGPSGDGPRSWPGRLKSRLMRWIAERIAEQRLLWHLRRAPEAALVHPSDMPADRAHAVMRVALQRDVERHLRWFIIDGGIFVLTGILAVVPGPNLLAYYFAFRVVGHYLSWRGARHGLRGVAWTSEASEPLCELRHVGRLEPATRGERLRDIATSLSLEHLPKFFERVALKGA